MNRQACYGKGKGKGCHTPLEHMQVAYLPFIGLEPLRCLDHWSVMHSQCDARSTVTFQEHKGVNSLPRDVMQLRADPESNPRSQLRCPTHCTTTPPLYWVMWSKAIQLHSRHYS